MKRKNYNLMIGGAITLFFLTVLDAVWDDDDGLHGSQSGAVCSTPAGNG